MPSGSGQTSVEGLGDVPAFFLAGRALACAPGGCCCCFCCCRCCRHLALRFLNQTWGARGESGCLSGEEAKGSPHGAQEGCCLLVRHASVTPLHFAVSYGQSVRLSIHSSIHHPSIHPSIHPPNRSHTHKRTHPIRTYSHPYPHTHTHIHTSMQSVNRHTFTAFHISDADILVERDRV